MKRALENSSDQSGEKKLPKGTTNSSNSNSSVAVPSTADETPVPIIYDEKGPFQEFGEDESDSGDEQNADESDDGSDVSEGEDIYSLPRTLLEFSKAQQFTDRSKSESAATKALTIILELYPHLLGMIKKARARSDGKVAPGSNEVKRNYSDMRFLLSLICIELGRHREVDNDFEKAKERYQDALISFPKSIEANFLLSKLEKAMATTSEELKNVEKMLKKAIGSYKSMNMDKAALASETLEYREIIQTEMESGEKAIDELCLLLCQQDRAQEAVGMLHSQGHTHRLSDNVLNYQEIGAEGVAASSSSDTIPVKVIENAVSYAMLSKLRYIFREESPFWKEHDYDILANASRKSGYFSYMYPMKERKASNFVEQVIDEIYKNIIVQHPEVEKECNYIEWWVHIRPHCNGHQLHFDSDETAIEGGKSPMHPIVSSVLFVSDDAIGGPTLITNQVLNGDGLATEGWMVHPKQNRLVSFDAKYLHGVIPGKGCPKNASDRRITFMVGFWRDICAKPRGRDIAGPGQPYPVMGESKYTWLSEFGIDTSLEMVTKKTGVDESRKHTHCSPIHIDRVWQRVVQDGDGDPLDPASNEREIPNYNRCFQGF